MVLSTYINEIWGKSVNIDSEVFWIRMLKDMLDWPTFIDIVSLGRDSIFNTTVLMERVTITTCCWLERIWTQRYSTGSEAKMPALP